MHECCDQMTPKVAGFHGFVRVPRLAMLQDGEVEKHRIHHLILQADAKQQQVQDSIAARPRGGARDELISELIQSRLAVSRAQMNAEAGVSEQMIEEQQEVIAWLWRILEHAGMTQAQVNYDMILHIRQNYTWCHQSPISRSHWQSQGLISQAPGRSSSVGRAQGS